MKRRIAAALLLILMIMAVGCSQNDRAEPTDQPVLSSGEKREKTITISVDLPDGIPTAKLEVYVDGIPDFSKSTTVDTSFKNSVNFTFNGTQGKRDVRIKLNDQLYKIYEIDFDSYSFKEIN